MKETEINERVKQAFSQATPDILDTILSDCKNQKGTVIDMTEAKSKKKFTKRTAGLVACLALVVGGAFGTQVYRANYAIASTVSLDVNPSIQITVNQKERVLDVIP